MKRNIELLQKLAECAAECERCIDACLDDENIKVLVRPIRLCRDCAKICYTTASFIASNSEHAQHLVDECTEICRICAEACDHHKEDEYECKTCASICRECEEACRSFQGVTG